MLASTFTALSILSISASYAASSSSTPLLSLCFFPSPSSSSSSFAAACLFSGWPKEELTWMVLGSTSMPRRTPVEEEEEEDWEQWEITLRRATESIINVLVGRAMVRGRRLR